MTDGEVASALRRRAIGTVAQWSAAGLSRGHLRALVRAGKLVEMRRGVYATAALVTALEGEPGRAHALRVAAAMLVTRTRPVVASYESAARIHGLDLLTGPPGELVTLTRPPGTAAARTKQTRYVAAELFRGQVTKRHGVPVTTVARSVVDLARALPFIDGVVVADSALHASKVTKAELAAVLSRCAGWQGTERARRVVEFSDGRSESVLESSARVVFERNGLEPPELQTYIRTREVDFRVDFYWPKHRTIAEADGKKKYKDTENAIAQLKRDELLRETGRHVVHFTWQDAFYRERRLIQRLTETFAR